MRPKEIVHRFLASMGRPEATEQYLRLFQAERSEGFALVVITARALEESSNAVVADLIFLRELELTPVLCVESAALAQTLIAKLPKNFTITQADLTDAAQVARNGQLPLLVAHHEGERQAAAQTLRPRKIVYLIGQSGLQPQDQPVRSLVNLRIDYDKLAAELRPEQATLLTEVRDLFTTCEHTFTVSLTSAQDLLRELFTVKGAGTLVRRGTKVRQLQSYSDLDTKNFSDLLHSAFGKRADPIALTRPTLAIYLAASYQGAAILEATPLAPYLSKFAVDLQAQGEGIGGDLWRALCQNHPRFFWRGRPKNPIAPWYAAKCDGLVRTSEWITYWRGLDTSEIGQAVHLATTTPLDFRE